MAFSIPDDLAPEVYPLAWLVGDWRGEGVISYPSIPESKFIQTVTFDHDGGPYLRYNSTIRLPAHDGGPGGEPTEEIIWSTESGFWRVTPDRPEGLGADRTPLEVMVSDPSGLLTLYLGAVGNGRVDLVSDLIARTSTGAEVSAANRMYGLVEGTLMWVWELAAFGHPLQSYASAQLIRQES